MSVLDEIVEFFSNNKDVLAVVLGGSRRNQTPDSMSDFDIYVYCENPISVSDREIFIDKYADKKEINNQRWECGDEFVDSNGTVYDIMYRHKSFIEGNIEWVYKNGNASMGYSTACLYNFVTAKILFDKDGWYKDLQEKTANYPDILQKNIIEKNYPCLRNTISSYRCQIEKAIDRNDLVSINHRITAFLASYFDVIFAINKCYHPGEKKLINLATDMCEKLPSDFESNIESLLSAKNEKILVCIDSIVDELEKILK